MAKKIARKYVSIGLVSVFIVATVLALVSAAGRHLWTPVPGARIFFNGNPVSGSVYRSTYGWYLVRNDHFPGDWRSWDGYVVAPRSNGVCYETAEPPIGVLWDAYQRVRHPDHPESPDFIIVPGAMYSKQVPCDCDDYNYYDSQVRTDVVLQGHSLEFTGLVLINADRDKWDTPRIKVVW